METPLINTAAGAICLATINWSNTNTKLMMMQNDLRNQGAQVLQKTQELSISTAREAANAQESATKETATGQLISGALGLASFAISTGITVKASTLFQSDDPELTNATELKTAIENGQPSVAAVSSQNAPVATPEQQDQIDAWKGSAASPPRLGGYKSTPVTEGAIAQLSTQPANKEIILRNLESRIAELTASQTSRSVQRGQMVTQSISEVNQGISATAQGGCSMESAKYQNTATKEESYKALLNSLEQSFATFIGNLQSAAQANQQTALQTAASISTQLASAA